MIPYLTSDQTSFHVGPVTLHAFGMLVATGIIVASRIMERRSMRLGLDPAVSASLVIWVLVGGFIGAHLVDALIYHFDYTRQDPWRLLRIWEGISSFGGFLGASIGAALFLRTYKLGADAWHYLDITSFAFPVGWLFGRTGCFTAHDHPGVRTDFFLAVQYPGGPRHDLGLYEVIYSAFIIVVFLVLDRRPRRPGTYTALLAVLYAPVRFGFDFLRVADVRYPAEYGLTPGQYGAIVLFIVGVILLVKARRGDFGEALQPLPPSRKKADAAT